jgi:heme exporter protein D
MDKFSAVHALAIAMLFLSLLALLASQWIDRKTRVLRETNEQHRSERQMRYRSHGVHARSARHT